MTRRDIERFFTALAKSWPHPAECIVIGGAAAVLDGSTRPTMDVDFEVTFGGVRAVEDPEVFAGALRETMNATGVEGQFTEDIAAWSAIALPPYRSSTRRWRSFGPIKVRLLDPALYVVTKLRRGRTDDFTDLLLVAGRHHTTWRDIASACAASVRASPRSTQLRGFMKRVEFLFGRHGRNLWGPGFDPARAIALFRSRSARPRRRRPA